MNKYNINLLLIQDTGKYPTTFSADVRNHYIHFSTPPSSDPAGGMAIICHNSLKEHIKYIDPDPNVNLLNLPFTLNHRIMLYKMRYPVETYIINAYVKKKNAPLYEKIADLSPLIIAGDLNSFPNPHLDYFSSKNLNRSNPRPVTQLIENGYIDTYRLLHPEKVAFTRYGSRYNKYAKITHVSASRIDHILITDNLVNTIKNSVIIDKDVSDSDHRILYLDICSDHIPPKYPPNSSLARKFISDKNKWKKDFYSLVENNVPLINSPNTSDPVLFANELNSSINSAVINALDSVFPIYTKLATDPDVIDVPTKSIPGTENYTPHLSTANKVSSILTKELIEGKNEIPSEALPYLIKLNNTCCKGAHAIPLQGTLHTALEFVNKTRKFLHFNIKRIKNKHKKDSVKEKIVNKFKNIQDNPQQIFSLYKNIIKNKIFILSKLINGKIQILIENEMITEITNNWKKIFSSIAPAVPLDEFLENMPKINTNYSIPTPDFSPSNLRRIIKSKHNTAPGNSKISWKCLKNAPDSLLTKLSELYSFVYTNNTLPDNWYKGMTVLIEKPTDDIGLDRYRPITLLSVEYKLFSHVLTETLVKILKENNIIPIAQNGFFPDRGSDQCIHSLINIIGNSIQFNKELHVLYLDLAKAFDSVEHWVIKDILQYIGTGYLGEVILSTLLHSSTQIETGIGWTDSIKFGRGTKQGDIISPILFALFTAPLLWTLQKSNPGYNIANTKINSLAIADDLALIAETNADISKLFYTTKKYFNKVGMVINPKKSASAYRSDNPFIPIVNNVPFKDLASNLSYKYLGIYINLELDWGMQTDTCITTYKAAVNIILKKFYLTCNQHIKLINSIAIAALAYRMQFTIFPAEVANKLLYWTIYNISKTHHISHLSIYPQFWTNYKGLLDIHNLNLAIYINNVYKNLNKPNLIAFNILDKCIAPQLNCSPYRPTILHMALPIEAIQVFKTLKIDLVNTNNFKRLAKIFPSLSVSTITFWEHLSKLYNTNVNRSLLSTPPNKPFPIENPPFSATAFVDGSCSLINKVMTMALMHSISNFSYTCNVQGPLNSLEPELVAIEYVITLLANCQLIFIFTDSLSAIKSIRKFYNINTNGRLKTTNRATLYRILDLAETHKFKFCYEFGKHLPLIPNQKLIVFYHIHSHMLTNKEKRLKHWDHHVNLLGDFTLSAAHLNDRVDVLAQEINSKPVEYAPPIITAGNDIWMPFNLVENTPIFISPKKYIYEELQKHDLTKFIQEEGEFAKRFFSPLVSRKYTTTLFKSKDVSVGYLADFLQKLLEKSLPTRLRIYNSTKKQRYNAAINKTIDDPLYKLRKYNDCFCVWCAIKESKYIAEDTTHIFSECPASFPIKEQLTTTIIKIINNSDIFMSSIPVWYSGTQSRLPLSSLEEEISNFPKNIGDIGYFPQAVVKWTKDLRPKDYKRTLKTINLEIIKTLHKIWTNRCDFFHKNALKIEELSLE